MPPRLRLAGASVSWRLSFHSGMNAAETSACRGIRIGCVSAPRRDAVRTSPRSWPGTTRRLRTDRSTAWLAGRFQSREGLTHDPAAALGQRDQILTEPVFNRCAARLASRAERSAWSWTSTLEIRPDLENDEIAGWRRRGHRDADARRGARFYPGRWAVPHHRDMAPFIPRGMNAADTSAYRGIRIGCVSAPRLDAVRTSPRSWPGT